MNALKVSAAPALAALLLAGCGGGGDRTKVAANLQHYLNTFAPQHLHPGGFPFGAGPPRVKENGCEKISGARARPAPNPSWSCVVTFAHIPFRVLVALKGSDQVAWAAPVPRHLLRPATVYQGGPSQPKP